MVTGLPSEEGRMNIRKVSLQPGPAWELKGPVFPLPGTGEKAFPPEFTLSSWVLTPPLLPGTSHGHLGRCQAHLEGQAAIDPSGLPSLPFTSAPYKVGLGTAGRGRGGHGGLNS